ncbi:MAG: energy transducer TonB [Sulfuriferula sp.]|nr:energy transducer TonB [Sulfuriferula sp.]
MSNNSALEHHEEVPTSSEPSLPRAFLVALGLEIVILFTGSALIANAKSNPVPQQQVVELNFEEPKPAPKEAAKPVPKPVVQPPQIKHVVVPHIQPPVHVAAAPAAVPPPSTPAPVVSAPVTAPVVAAPPPPPPPVASHNETAEKEAAFSAQLKAAIQAALIYPPAARMMSVHGKAQVEFEFEDGTRSQIHVIQSSGSTMLDQAAIQAASNARIPPTPEFLKGKKKTYQIWVEFNLGSTR